MRNRATAAILAVVLAGLFPAAALAQFAPLVPYSQDFEQMVQTDPDALSADDWLVFGTVFDADMVWQYQYGAFPAPNHNVAFSNIALLEGGVEQGIQQLSVFSDYENADHALGWWIESNVFHEWEVQWENVGEIWTFQFDAKKGVWDDVPPSQTTTMGFIKTLDKNNGWALTNFLIEDTTGIPTEWGTYQLEIGITPDLVGQVIQIGFSSLATEFGDSGVFYDNVVWGVTGIVSAVPELASGSLGQNYPNPFNPMTRIDFVLETAGMVDVSVYDLAGRRVATLHRGELGSGDHHVMWDGRTDAGYAVAAGQYRYVMKTDAGQTARSMTLLK